ncbi:hypothetical protein ACHAWC_005165 [Mediolabrus comicus]
MTHQFPPDEIIANILHLQNKTNVSALQISRNTTTTTGSTAANGCDLLQPFQGQSHKNGGGPMHEGFLESWINSVLSGHEHEDDMNLKDALHMFTTMSTAVDETNRTKDEDISLWLKGLKVLHSIIISQQDTELAPHELLRTVMDSYYFRADDREQVSSLIPSSTSSSIFHLPTLVAMFILRSLLITHAIQTAESSTRFSLQRSETIRWRRLKSMVEDTIALFQRMLLDSFESVADNFDDDTQKDHQMKSEHFITIATWLYTKLIFPSCQSLLSLLLEENHGDGIVNPEDGVAAKLYGILTLLAAHGTSVVSDRGTDQMITTDRLVIYFINDPNSDTLWTYSRSFRQDSKADYSGQSLEEDLLLYKRPFYNQLGQATIAFLRLQAQIHPTIDNLAQPSPFSAEYRWALFFPHAITFLANGEVSHVKMGLDMLRMLIYDMPFIRPAQRCNQSTNKAVQMAHSSNLLARTVRTLLSLVLRLSALEASTPDSSSMLENSSLQVMDLAQKLLQLYDANVQVEAIDEVSRKMRDSDKSLIALLPKVLDWLRPIIIAICNQRKNSISDDSQQQLVLLSEVIRVFDPILNGLEEVFGDSPLPTEVASFFSMIEAYTSLFSSLRAMKMFRHHTTCVPSPNSEEMARLSFISDWLEQASMILECFKEQLQKLIDFWSSEASCPPADHHRCFLLHYHLEEALIDLTK